MTPEGGGEPIGRYLARQRRLRGISLDDLSLATHIPRRSLERLESGAFDGKPDGFARGFVRTVAAAIGLDPDETVTRMLAEARPAAGPTRRIPATLLLALAVLLALGWLLASLPAWRPAPTPAAAPGVTALPHRRDFVRELAEARRGRAPVGSAPERTPEDGSDAPALEPPGGTRR